MFNPYRKTTSDSFVVCFPGSVVSKKYKLPSSRVGVDGGFRIRGEEKWKGVYCEACREKSIQVLFFIYDPDHFIKE